MFEANDFIVTAKVAFVRDDKIIEVQPKKDKLVQIASSLYAPQDATSYSRDNLNEIALPQNILRLFDKDLEVIDVTTDVKYVEPPQPLDLRSSGDHHPLIGSFIASNHVSATEQP